MYWGAVKHKYRLTAHTSTVDEMEQNMLACLDVVPLLTIRRFTNRSARFISAYDQGLLGSEAVWAAKRYPGHRTLPPTMAAMARAAHVDFTTVYSIRSIHSTATETQNTKI
ncbi:hypothetical protein MSAN_02366500 [Mycena sanguinolenta]|uniref:Uncharacterized protein n=1 Tax=Mycena sanguinolenta TaxID=230812 RepID=A0A8H6X5W6_9AGAR|nr:hypothetical protein MSAN_02366500 [Mycena sanguinolenta]